VTSTPHARGPTASMFDDLLDGSIIATRYYRDARPLWVRCLSHGQRFRFETASTKQADDARKLACWSATTIEVCDA